MPGKDSTLDVLIISEEYTKFEDQCFNDLHDQVRNDLRLFTGSVKSELEARYNLKDFMIPFPGSASGPNGSPNDPTKEEYIVSTPHRPSLALVDLATVIKASGYSVCLIDNFIVIPWRWQQIEDIIENHAPRLIGISTTFLFGYESVSNLVESIRDLAPESKIVLGGMTSRAIEQLHSCADFTVFGEGEEPILGILEVLDGKRHPSEVENIAYLDDDGSMQYSTGGRKSALVGELGVPFKARPEAKIPIPDWTLYGRNLESVLSIEFSRGCKYNCFYCAYDRGKVTRDLDDIKTELLRNADLGITKYRTADSNFTDGPPRNKRYPYDICQLKIDLDLGLDWSCYSRVDDLDDELAGLMKAAGCFALFFGVESGDDSILKLMRKGHNVADAYKGIEVAKRHGLFVHANFVVGYPGETRETYQNTLEFIERSRPDSVTFGHFYMSPRSPVYGKRMADFDIQGQGMHWSHKTMNSETAGELLQEGIAHLTKLGIPIANELEFPVMMSVGLTVNEIKEVVKGRSMRHKYGYKAMPPSNTILPWLDRMAAEVSKDHIAMKNCGF